MQGIGIRRLVFQISLNSFYLLLGNFEVYKCMITKIHNEYWLAIMLTCRGNTLVLPQFYFINTLTSWSYCYNPLRYVAKQICRKAKMDVGRLTSYPTGTKQLKSLPLGAKMQASHEFSIGTVKLCFGVECDDAYMEDSSWLCDDTWHTVMLMEPGTGTAELTAFNSIKTHFSFEAKIYPCDNFCGEMGPNINSPQTGHE